VFGDGRRDSTAEDADILTGVHYRVISQKFWRETIFDVISYVTEVTVIKNQRIAFMAIFNKY
jgi:hypothetical protein